MLAIAGSTLDLETRREAYCQLSDLIAAELPEIRLYLSEDGQGFSNRLHGYTMSTWGSLTWDAQNWTLDPLP